MAEVRYRLERVVGSGGMARVYEAVAVLGGGLERRVAIKRILPELSDREAIREMFLDEARVATALHHGNIVQLVDYGYLDGQEFIVMEYVEGVDARSATKSGAEQGRPIPEGVALHIVSELSHALDYAHRRTAADGTALGIVHRDVSPSNVLLSWDGDVKLSDFGIALWAQRRAARTERGRVKGKVPYMAPEQLLGEEVTGAADMFAVGGTLHTLLTGKPPARDLLAPDDPPRIDPELSAEVMDLVSRCLARSPAERPTAEAVAHRAGRLAAQALGRDGRGPLREWLAAIRGPERRPDAMDALLGLCLSANDAGARRFTVSDLSRAASPSAEEIATEPPTLRDDRPPPMADRVTASAHAFDSAALLDARESRPPTVDVRVASRPRVIKPSGDDAGAFADSGTATGAGHVRPRHGLLIAGAFALAAIGVAVGVAVAPGAPSPAAGAARTGDGPTASAADDGVEEPVAAPPPRAAEEVAAVEERRSGEDPPPGAVGRPTVEAPSPRPVTIIPSDRPAPAAAGATGHVRVGGAALLDAVVTIDGRPQALRSPAVYELPTGTHRIEVTAADGRVLVRRTVRLQADHTRATPLALVLRDPPPP